MYSWRLDDLAGCAVRGCLRPNNGMRNPLRDGGLHKAIADLGLDLHVLDADTVQQAKELTAQHHVDLVVLDRMLADNEDGLAYIAWLNELEIPRPGILITSSLGSHAGHGH